MHYAGGLRQLREDLDTAGHLLSAEDFQAVRWAAWTMTRRAQGGGGEHMRDDDFDQGGDFEDESALDDGYGRTGDDDDADDQGEDMLPGERCLSQVHGKLTAIKGLVHSHLSRVEHPQVRRLLEREAADLDRKLAGLAAAASDIYPETFGGDDDGDEDEEALEPGFGDRPPRPLRSKSSLSDMLIRRADVADRLADLDLAEGDGI